MPSDARREEDTVLRFILPVGRSPLAIIAGYLGLISVLLFPAPFALAFGIAAVVHVRASPARRGLGRAIFAIVMGAIFSAVLAALILAASLE